MKASVKRFIKRIRNTWTPQIDNEELIKRIGAFAVHEYLNSRHMRRRLKGTKLEKVIKSVIE